MPAGRLAGDLECPLFGGLRDRDLLFAGLRDLRLAGLRDRFLSGGLLRDGDRRRRGGGLRDRLFSIGLRDRLFSTGLRVLDLLL